MKGCVDELMISPWALNNFIQWEGFRHSSLNSRLHTLQYSASNSLCTLKTLQ